MAFTHAEIIRLHTGLINLKGYKSIKFNYAIAKTIDNAETQIKPLSKQEQSINDITKEFNEKRLEICRKFAAKDESGNPKLNKNEVTGSDSFVFEGDIYATKVSPAIETLRVEHKEAIDEQLKRAEEYSKLLQEVNPDFKVYPLPTSEDMKTILDKMPTEDILVILPLIPEELIN